MSNKELTDTQQAIKNNTMQLAVALFTMIDFTAIVMLYDSSYPRHLVLIGFFLVIITTLMLITRFTEYHILEEGGRI